MRKTLLAIIMLVLSTSTVILAGDFENAVNAEKNHDCKKAVELYLRAGNQGNAKAQSELGAMYKLGDSNPNDPTCFKQDYKESVKWYIKAAEQGYVTAQNNLGMMYEQGKGVKQSYKEAIKWYRMGAEQGDATSQYFLGSVYDYGIGVKNQKEAIKCYSKAAEQGYKPAKEALERLQKH